MRAMTARVSALIDASVALAVSPLIPPMILAGIALSDMRIVMGSMSPAMVAAKALSSSGLHRGTWVSGSRFTDV